MPSVADSCACARQPVDVNGAVGISWRKACSTCSLLWLCLPLLAGGVAVCGICLYRTAQAGQYGRCHIVQNCIGRTIWQVPPCTEQVGSHTKAGASQAACQSAASKYRPGAMLPAQPAHQLGVACGLDCGLHCAAQLASLLQPLSSSACHCRQQHGAQLARLLAAGDAGRAQRAG